ncbi:MAG: tetratricopeptide repeat protein [Theionarchaea archaeon]|nr:tetratricopeptide repeat protein [Theionarchaea archaeon]
MQVTARRKNILKLIDEKGPLSYKEILGYLSKSGNPVDILNDLDTLVFFRFLQHKGICRSLAPETVLELRPKTRIQIKNTPLRINERLSELQYEIPPWYRKRALLSVLTRAMNEDCITEELHRQYPHIKWSPLLVEALLGILAESRYVSRKKKGGTTYTRTPKSESLLNESLIKQFLELRKLKNEFTNEFRTLEILKLVITCKGISSGDIVRYFKSEFGIRGNKRRAITNTLKNMAFSGLLRVAGGTELKGGHVYYPGETMESLFSGGGGEIMYHGIRNFKKTVKQFFEEYKPTKGTQLIIENALNDLDQCKEGLLQKSPDCWVNHIVALSKFIHQGKENIWGNQILQCIVACILSRLLPSETTVEILRDFPVPLPASEKEYIYYHGVVREYYFNLTEAYLDCGDHEKALQCFDYLSLLSWESSDFWVLKGRLEMLKRDLRSPDEFQHMITPFQEALQKSDEKIKNSPEEFDEKERIAPLFYMGLLQYQRGDLEEAKEAWRKCLNLVSSIYWKTTLYHNLGNVYWLSGEFENAQKYYRASVSSINPPPDMDEPGDLAAFYGLRAKSLLGLTNVLIDSGSWEEAERMLKELIEESIEQEVFAVAAIAQTNLGDLLTRKKDYEKALLCHQEALTMVDEERNPREYGIILINQGNTLRLLKRADEALNTFKKAHTLIGRENSLLIQDLNVCEADLYCDINLEKSWELSHAVLQETWIGNTRAGAGAYRVRGKIYVCRKDFHEARRALEKSLNIFKALNIQYELMEVYELLELCSANLKDGKEAFYRSRREALQKLLSLS